MVMVDDAAKRIGLSALLKRILFDEEELFSLKERIRAFGEGSLTAKEFKTYIVKARLRMLGELKDLLPLLASYGQESSIDASALEEKIQEREELLEDVTDRVETILKQMKSTS